MRRLFVNADDFGLTEGVSQGILEAMAAGVVAGTTAMVCVPRGVERIARLGPAIAGRVGLHLQLTGGRPCLPAGDVATLVTGEGTFPRKKIAVTDVDPDEVRREWRAQLARFRATGLVPSHLDSHHHIHKRPEVFPVFLELARELGVPARALSDDMRQALAAAGVPHADNCVTRFFGEDLSAERFLALVDAAFAELGETGVVEVMAHPGRVDAELLAISTYAAGREEELRVFADPALAKALADRGIVFAAPAFPAAAAPRPAATGAGSVFLG
uniref:Carbohydrate deacetylase n=1 Tax=Desulfovibrio sp. U5L TaxID=596152 RepID=I2Q127_9BACT